jgi:choline dehydrogenase
MVDEGSTGLRARSTTPRDAPAGQVGRRLLTRGAAGLVAGAAGSLGGCANPPPNPAPARPVELSPSAPVEYIVVGSGAGGGPLAVNLARAGHKVVLLEAGGDTATATYSVPVFHGLAAEDPELCWAYFVHHYADTAQQRRDSKYVPGRDGIFYPRAGTLGGCTAHNAMITVYPHNSDWDHIAEITGDASWRSEAMRAYFERLERCEYRPPWENPRDNPGRHGFAGWLTTNMADPRLLAGDRKLHRVLLSAAEEVGLGGVLEPFLLGRLDPNDWRVGLRGPEGLYNVPLATRNGRRIGTRELIQETARALPNNLVVRTNALVTRVLFEGRRAIGVEYLAGPRLYRADLRAPASGPELRPRQRLLASREVILAAGAFNSPQLLKLSGVGPRNELASFGIPVNVDLPGVGENLQDRYEVGVVTRMTSDFAVLKGCSLAPPQPGEAPDPCYAAWLQGRGIYTTNGTVLGIAHRSSAARSEADLFIFGLPGLFRGYYPGYSDTLAEHRDHFTWVILKAHTRNTAGSVRLRSADPRDTPEVTFRYFEEGSDLAGEDLGAAVAGVEFTRRMNRHLYRLDRVAREEVVPGPGVASATDVARFVTDEAWGHHASCSNRIGPPGDPAAVVGSDFRVHGTQGLRVVDASVFPRIPGFFIVTPIYMISEKASDVILADAR